MELMLTSFAISHLERRARRETDLFYRMPPVSLGRLGQDLAPDYAALLVADRIVVDQKTYDFLMTERSEWYDDVALVLKTLHDEGFVRLEDFDDVIAQNRDTLKAMLERDLMELDSWVNPLKASIAEWHRCVAGCTGQFRRDIVSSHLAPS